jgi:ABC-type transporter Mla subunit MlaD
LQRLAEQDPTKLAAIATEASQALRSAAASSIGDTARGLNQLADGFARTASTGDVSNLHLASPTRSRHHHASGAAKLYAGGSNGVPQTAAAKLEAVSLQVDQALGLNPPPLGPWGNE